MQKEFLRITQFTDKINNIYKSESILLKSNLSDNIENKFKVNIDCNKKIPKNKKIKKKTHISFQNSKTSRTNISKSLQNKHLKNRKKTIFENLLKSENYPKIKIQKKKQNSLPTFKILKNMLKSEKKWLIKKKKNPNTEINSKMRLILIDWLLKVTKSFSLSPETFILTNYYLEKFSQENFVSKKKYQLLGLTCLYIASKYEEIKPPKLKEFVYICDGAFKAKNVILMEAQVLKFLKFELFVNSPFEFLGVMKEVFYFGDLVFEFCSNLILKSFLDYKVFLFLPRVLAISAVLLFFWIEGESNKFFFEKVGKVLFLNVKEVEDCMKFLYKVLNQKISLG